MILQNNNNIVEVAKLGKSFGIRGGVRIFITSDFKELFIDGFEVLADATFLDSKTDYFKLNMESQSGFYKLKVKSLQNNIIYFHLVSSKEISDFLKNLTIFNTLEYTREKCTLRENEFFYFDIIGLRLIENNEVIGIVTGIEEISNCHYFIIDDKQLIPYIDKYIIKIDLESKSIFSKDVVSFFQ